MHTEPDCTSLISRIKKMNVSSNGIRIVANLRSRKTPVLVEFHAFKAFLRNEVSQYRGLNTSAEFYHNFGAEGFAGIDCFRGSHVSVRTYPGVNDIVFDLFLSNEFLDNENISQDLYQKTVRFFESEILTEKVVRS